MKSSMKSSVSWSWVRSSKYEVIKNLLQTSKEGVYTVVVRKNELQGNVLWAIHAVSDISGKVVGTYIVCTALSEQDGMWGWKSYHESDNPPYYGVPLAWLDEVATDDPVAKHWREIVKHFSAGAQKVGPYQPFVA